MWLGEIHLARESLHLLAAQRPRIDEYPELISFQRLVGEHVDNDIGQQLLWHAA
jgi:hypothetical protein